MKRYWIFKLLLGCCYATWAAGVDWHEPGAEARAVFTREAGPQASVLVTVPFSGAESAQARAFTAGGREIPIDIVHQSGKELHILVRTGAQRAYANGVFYVYYGQGLRELREELVNKDYEPVTVDYYSNRGRSIPTDWTRMQHLLAEQGAPVRTKTQDGIEDVAPLPASGGSYGRSRQRRRSSGAMVRISTHIIIPEPGLYRFHLDCNDAGFVMLDRRMQVEWPGRHARGTWRQGDISYLDSGPHILEVYGAASHITRAKVAVTSTQTEDRKVRVEDFLLVSSLVPKALRIEEKEKTLHAGFSYSLGRPYKFRDTDPVFVPVTLQDFSGSDLSWQYQANWSPATEAALTAGASQVGVGGVFQAGRRTLEGNSVTHVFDSLGLHRVSLELRDALGFQSVLERQVDTRNLHYREYAVGAVPVNVVPCLFSEDTVDPSIRVSAKCPEPMDFLLEWKWHDVKGRERTGSRKLSMSSGARTIRIFSARAADVSEAEWELSHRGYRINGGRMLFNRFPYAAFPHRAVEDRLYDSKGNQLFYVSSRAQSGFRQPAIRTAHLKGGVLMLDDVLAVPRPMSGDSAGYSKMLAGMLSIGEEEVALRDLSASGGHDHLGAAGVLRSVSAETESRSGIVMLSVGMEHFLAYDRPSDFERLLAAAVDIIASRRSMRAIMVTLPPVGEDREAAREYAAAVRRVAGARGIPVADLYSAFMGMGQDIELFMGSGPELSDAGIRLSCQVIARAIVHGYRAEGSD